MSLCAIKFRSKYYFFRVFSTSAVRSRLRVWDVLQRIRAARVWGTIGRRAGRARRFTNLARSSRAGVEDANFCRQTSSPILISFIFVFNGLLVHFSSFRLHLINFANKRMNKKQGGVTGNISGSWPDAVSSSLASAKL